MVDSQHLQLAPASMLALILVLYAAMAAFSYAHFSDIHGASEHIILSMLVLLTSGTGFLSALMYISTLVSLLPSSILYKYLAATLYVLSSQAFFFLNITLSDERAHCDSAHFTSGWLCSHQHDTSSFTMLCVMLCPYFVAAICSGDSSSSISASGCSFLVSLTSLTFAAFWKTSTPTFMSIVMYILLCISALLGPSEPATLLRSSSETRSAFVRHNILPLMSGRSGSGHDGANQVQGKGEHVCKASGGEERESSHFGEQAKEMKHMIANVAHDLKTPLASFMTGIDVMSEILFECKDKLDTRQLTLSFIEHMLAELQQCLRSSRVTNSFMMMTINRCIDYTKASKGMKLVPKYETMDLYETLVLPLGCMKNIQNKVTIEMNPIPTEICSHIISDKQWLQENLLCLLSNAAKYSSGGQVIVTVSLEPVDVAPLVEVSETSDSLDPKEENGMARSASLVKSKTSFKPMSNRVAPDESEYSALNTSRTVSTHSHWSRRANTEHSHMLKVEVEDTGIGMDEQSMSELFSPFKQTQRLAGGTGLGLFSLAKRTDALRGSCGVRKRKDGQQGSLFWFTLPYRPDQAQALRRSTMFGSRIFGNAQMKLLRSALSSANLFTVDLSCRSSGSTSGPNQPMGLEPSVSVNARSSFILDSHAPVLGAIAEEDAEALILARTTSSAATADLPPFQPNAFELIAATVSSGTLHDGGREEPDGMHILVVDDSPSVVKMTIMMLKRNGYIVSTADNGAVALETIKKKVQQHLDKCCTPPTRVFDVILMDLQMPVMDGLEATRRLRQYEESISTPSLKVNHFVVGLSANCDDDVLNETQNVGFNDFLPKPFSLSSFLEVLESLHAHEGEF